MSRISTLLIASAILLISDRTLADDPIRDLQTLAVEQQAAPWGHWGPDPSKYSSWKSHSNRLIPVYTFGSDLSAVVGEKSPYRDGAALEQLFGYLPTETVNPQAEYFDQTAVYHLQRLAMEAGKKHIVLIVFDGMDWQTTWAAANQRAGRVAYRQGRGTGLYFQDYRGVETDFGYFVTSPHSGAAKVDVNRQQIVRLSKLRGGYSSELGGNAPWLLGSDPLYPIGKSKRSPHAYTDSASSATSLISGIKTYNSAINFAPDGKQVVPISRQLQQHGYAVGIVTSVPISHATPACAYGNNVNRGDYQDITRDLLGLPSVSHADPLPGVDVLLGGGWGEKRAADDGQGDNYAPGNKYISQADMQEVNVHSGGKYTVVERRAGADGARALQTAAEEARDSGTRLFGLFGTTGGHLPFRTADGHYNPTSSVGQEAEDYSAADIRENPTLSDMAGVALDTLKNRSDRFWLLIESGDVDWANHKNNIDNSIGAVLSGDDAFRTVTNWIEQHDAWKDSVVILTADHSHYLVLNRPDMLLRK